MLNIISNEQRKHLHKLRQKRNEIVHQLKDISRNDSNSCLKTAESILFYVLKSKGINFKE